MRILFILELYYPNIGGIEKLFKTLAEKLVEEGHSVKVITTRFSKNLPTSEIINGVEVNRLKIRSRFLFTFFGIFGMMKEAKNCDIIHTTSFNAALPARLAGCFARKKVLITFHEAWGKLWFKLPYAGFISRRLYYFYEWFILRLGFYRFIAVSDYTANSLKRLGVKDEKIIRIYNGLDYNDFNSAKYSPTENFTVTYFGRLGISKGLDLILGAAPVFLTEYPDVHLQLILPDRPKSFLRKIKKGLQNLPQERYTLRHNLSYSELQETLLNSTCVMIPSYSEGFCFAAAETIALGIPLISSGKGALSEVVSGKFITMDSQSSEGLLLALQKAYSGKWEETPIKQFHFNDTVEAYLSLYGEM